MCTLIIYTEEAAPRDLAACLAPRSGAPVVVKHDAGGWMAAASDGSLLRVEFEALTAPPISPEMLAGPGAAGATSEIVRLGAARARYVIEAPEGLVAARRAVLLGAAIAEAVQGLLFDPIAGMLLLPAEARGIGESGSPEALVAGLVRAHALALDDGVWVHTHGAARLGLPEVEALSIDPDVAAAAAAAAIALLARWAGEGSAGPAPIGVEFPLGAGRARIVASRTGAARPPRATCADDPGRVEIVSADGSDISSLLGGRPSAERAAERAAADRDRARAVIGVLSDRLASSGGALPEGVRVFAEVALEVTGDGSGSGELELVWLPVERVRGDILETRVGTPSGASGKAAVEAAQVLGVLVTSGDRELETLGEVMEAVGPTSPR